MGISASITEAGRGKSPSQFSADPAYTNARSQSDRQNARIEYDKALSRVMTAVLRDDTKLFKRCMDNEFLRRRMSDTVFGLTYDDRPSP